MKKIICLLMILIILPFSALAESVDVSTLSASELLNLWQAAGDRLKEIGAYPYIELSKGDEGIDVTNLQTRLTALYYYSGELTGKYDNSTVKAVKAFEKTNGLKQNGIMSIDEQDLLYSDQAVPKTTPTPKPTATPAPTPLAANDVLTITDVRLYDYYSSRVFSIDVHNNSTNITIDAFDIVYKCYNSYGELISGGLFNSSGTQEATCSDKLSIKPKKTYSMKNNFWYLFSYSTTTTIRVAIQRYHTKSGETVLIEDSDYQWVSGDLQ